MCQCVRIECLKEEWIRPNLGVDWFFFFNFIFLFIYLINEESERLGRNYYLYNCERHIIIKLRIFEYLHHDHISIRSSKGLLPAIALSSLMSFHVLERKKIYGKICFIRKLLIDWLIDSFNQTLWMGNRRLTCNMNIVRLLFTDGTGVTLDKNDFYYLTCVSTIQNSLLGESL